MCGRCNINYATIEVRRVHFILLHRCEVCVKKEYNRSFISDRDAIHGNHDNALHLLNMLFPYEIPKKYLKEIFKYNGGRCLPSNIEYLAFVTFNPKICKRARLAIRTFCLFCIKYHKTTLNKDVRRKISQMIWDNKIEFLK